MSDLLELHDIAVGYDGRTVLHVPHLALRRGEILTLLGANGSGKTTLLSLLGLLIRPAQGTVLFDGEEVDFGSAKRLLELRRRMASVMQEPLLCRMSVRRNVALGLRFRRTPKPETDERVDRWLRRLSISDIRDRQAPQLSGGEARRASLARAMVLDPEVLFLDEPFSALDAPTRQKQLREFQGVLAESRVTTVFATHDRGEALELGDRVAVLMGGHLAQIGPTETVFSQPERVDVARFVGIETLIPGRVTGTVDGLVQVDCGEGRLVAEGESQAGENVYLAVRPEEIEIHDKGISPPREGHNTVSGRVTRIVPAETHYRVEVECGVPVVAAVGRARFREMPMEIGREVQATFPAGAARLIRRVGD